MNVHVPLLATLLLTAIAVAATAAVPATVGAHFGGQASVIVPLEYVDPGQSFPVIGADLGVDAGVTFRLVREDRTLELGRVSAGLDGHLQSTFDLPADFPLGYAELVAASDDGSRASTWILVGPPTNATLAPPNQPAIWQDPAVWLIGGMVAAGALALVVMTVRSSRRERIVAAHAGSGRRRQTRKSRRR